MCLPGREGATGRSPANAGARAPASPEKVFAMETDFSGLFGFGIVAVVFFVVLYAGLIALMFWLTYTVIWRAVRRGLREFHYPKQ